MFMKIFLLVTSNQLDRKDLKMINRRESDEKKFNLWDGLSVTFIVQRFFCIFPLKRQGNEIVHSLFATIYSIASLISYYSVLALAFYVLKAELTTKKMESVKGDEEFSKSYLVVVICVFELIFNNVGILVIVLFSYIKRNNHVLFLQKLYDIDLVILDELKVDINYKRLRKMCYTAYFTILTFYVGLNSLVFYKVHELHFLTPGVSLLATLYQFEQSTTAITTWAYINYVILLHHRFTIIRKRQEDLAMEKKMMLKNGVKFNENVSILSTLLMTYKELCSCIDVLNDMSGSILILRIAHDFTLTTSQVYMISWIIMDNNGSDKYELALSIFVWMFPNIVKMGLTTLLTEITVEEVRDVSESLI